MANIQAHKKSIRQDKKRELRNKSVKSEIKTLLSSFNQAVEKKDKKLAEETMRSAVKSLDKAVSKKVIHANQAANKKSNMMKKLNGLK